MRIVHVITKCDYGGAQTVVRELVLEQLRRGHIVSVVTGLLGPVAAGLEAAGVMVTLEPDLVHPISLRKDRRAVLGVVSALDAFGPDVVHTHSSKGGLVGRLAARHLDLATVYTAHGWPFQRGASTKQRVVSFAGEWVAARTKSQIVCVSSYEAGLARRLRLAPQSRVHIVANGIGRRGEVPPPRPPSTGRLELVMVARLSAPKRQDLLIDALRTAPGVGVTFIGDGPHQHALEHRASELRDRVRFLGYAEPATTYAGAHAAVLLSDYEGLPLAVIEAMRQGLPIIANRLPGLAGTLEHGRNALMCELSITSVVGAIDELRDADRRASLGLAAQRDWQDRFTSEIMADGYERIYASARSAH